jgi:hypothetical protein
LTLTSATPPRAAAVGCDVVAHAAVRATADELPALRRSPGALGGAAVPPSLLRHADDQTVVGLAAVLRAVSRGGLDPCGFGGWSVVVAPRFLGRSTFEAVFPRFLAEGAWGVSPHLIPNHSLHAPSGTVSLALQARGPNLGVGGAPGGEAEAFLTAATFLAEGSVAGVWIVLTGRCAGRDGGPTPNPPPCEALALAVTAARARWTGTRLRLAPGVVDLEPAAGASVADDPVAAALAGWIGAPASGDAAKTWRVDRGAQTRTPAPHRQAGRPMSLVRETRHER